MRKTSSKIRDEIERLQEQLKAAETKEAERIGRIATKAGLGDLDIEEGELSKAFASLAATFRRGSARSQKTQTKPAGTAESHA
jgi:hypothetical protein